MSDAIECVLLEALDLAQKARDIVTNTIHERIDPAYVPEFPRPSVRAATLLRAAAALLDDLSGP